MSNDAKKFFLTERGFTQDSIVDGMYAYYKDALGVSSGSIVDLEKAWLMGELGLSSSIKSRQDLWRLLLDQEGFSSKNDYYLNASAGWSPAPYFEEYDGGYDWNPNILSSMAQNSAGTTPSVVDSPVGYITDTEGDGLSLTQTSDVARPVLRESGGESYLEYSGAQSLFSGATSKLSEVTLFLRIRANGAPAAFASPYSTYLSPGTGHRIFNSGGSVIRLDTSAGTIVVSSASFPTTMQTFVLRWVNGRQLMWLNGGTSINDTSNAVLLNHTRFNLGMSSSGSGFWVGDIGRTIVVYGGMTVAEINEVGAEISLGDWSDVSF